MNESSFEDQNRLISATNRLPDKRKIVAIETVVIISLGVIPYLFNAALDFYFQVNHAPVSVDWHFIYTLERYFPVVFPALFIIWRSGDGWRHFGLKPVRAIRDSLWAIVIFVMARLGRLTFYRALYLTLPYSTYRIFLLDHHISYLAGPQNALDYPVIVGACLLNGFAEELIMRGYLLTRFEELFGNKIFAVALSAVLFGSYHIYQGWPAVAVITIDGLIFGAMFAYLRRLAPVAGAHALIDIAALIYRRG